jgi:membrane protein implicated in regulation of membrane protease activity
MRVFVGRSEGQETGYPGNMTVGGRVTLDHDQEAAQVGWVRFRGTMWDAVSDDRLPAGSEAIIAGVDDVNRSCLKIKSVPSHRIRQ